MPPDSTSAPATTAEALSRAFVLYRMRREPEDAAPTEGQLLALLREVGAPESMALEAQVCWRHHLGSEERGLGPSMLARRLAELEPARVDWLFMDSGALAALRLLHREPPVGLPRGDAFEYAQLFLHLLKECGATGEVLAACVRRLRGAAFGHVHASEDLGGWLARALRRKALDAIARAIWF